MFPAFFVQIRISLWVYRRIFFFRINESADTSHFIVVPTPQPPPDTLTMGAESRARKMEQKERKRNHLPFERTIQ